MPGASKAAIFSAKLHARPRVMSNEKPIRRSMFYPLTMVMAWSIPGAIFIILGAVQLFLMPQGRGLPEDPSFWHPLIPFGIVALVALVIAGVMWRLKTVRDVFLSAGIVFGCGTFGFGMMMFALAERASLEDFVQAAPVAPENSYVCKRQADGTMACLNAAGEANPGYTSTVVRR